MNSRDQANLDFIMNTSEKDFDEWLDTATQDDIDYAMELIRRSRTDKMIEIMELQDLMASHEDEMEDAQEVLSRFILK